LPVRTWVRDGEEEGVVEDGVGVEGVAGVELTGVDVAVTPAGAALAAEAIPPRPRVRVTPTRLPTVRFRILVIAAPSK
jgi:hypothetical protein